MTTRAGGVVGGGSEASLRWPAGPGEEGENVSDEESWPARIVVLDRGFVIACRCPDPMTVGLWLPAVDCRVVRRWGTTAGLGELAAGPLEGTVLDAPVAREAFPVRAVLRVLEVEQSPWKSHLTPATTTPAGLTRTSAGRSTRTSSRSPA